MGVLERISSYVTWPPHSMTSPLSLANAGFIYTGERDKVRCPICRLEIAGWSDEPGHVVEPARLHPRDEHRMRSPQCQLALECSIPDSEVISTIRNKFRQDHASPTRPRTDESTNWSTSQAGQNPPSENVRQVLKQVLDRATRRSSGCEVTPPPPPPPPVQLVVVDRTNPDFNELKSESARLGTYHDWPSTAPVKPEELAANGFFYTGQTDRVCCVFCRGILHNWQQGDVPSAEHRRHFRDCPLVRGQNVGNISVRGDHSAKLGTVSMTAGSSNGTSNECRTVISQSPLVTLGQSCKNEPLMATTGSHPSICHEAKLPLEHTQVNVAKSAESATLLTEDDVNMAFFDVTCHEDHIVPNYLNIAVAVP